MKELLRLFTTVAALMQESVTPKGSVQPKILFLGIQDAVNALLKKNGFFSDFVEVRNVNEWSMAEAIADPSRVSEPVDILRITPKKPSGFSTRACAPRWKRYLSRTR
jgi:hypothetical protein